MGEVGFALGRERRYSNSVELNISVYDFVFRFEETCMADDGTVGKHPVVDIVMSPQHAKALFHALNAAVQSSRGIGVRFSTCPMSFRQGIPWIERLS